MNKLAIITKYVFVIVGCGLILATVFVYQNAKTFLKSANEAEGIVVELLRTRSERSSATSGSSSTSYVYKPVVKFNTMAGKSIEFISSTGSNPASYSKGEKVIVLYLSTNPHNAKIKSFFSIWGVVVILGGIGCVFTFIGSVLLFVFRSNKRKKEQLMSFGIPIKTNFQSVVQNKSLAINGHNPFQVVTQCH